MWFAEHTQRQKQIRRSKNQIFCQIYRTVQLNWLQLYFMTQWYSGYVVGFTLWYHC